MHIGSAEWSDLIIEGAAVFDIDLDDGHTRLFAIHAAELVKWNQKINITAITDPFEIAVKHFLDSLTVARFIPGDATVLDIGTGGGFPGLPLKVLVPSLTATLIDASRKKVSFVKHVIRILKLDNIEAFHIRAEDFAKNQLNLNRFDVIVSRAVSSLTLFCRLAIPLLSDEGSVIAFKGEIVDDGLNDLQGRGGRDGDDIQKIRDQLSVTVEKFKLPILNSDRSLVFIRKRKNKFQ